MYESSDQKIFIGTTDGLLIYDRLKDRKNSIGSFTNINTIEINDKVYPYQTSFVLPYKKYTIKVSYSGINFSSLIKFITAAIWKTLILTGVI